MEKLSKCFKEQSVLTLQINIAWISGATHYDGSVVFMENSSVSFIGNVAVKAGGAVFSHNSYSKITQNSKVSFSHNTAKFLVEVYTYCT